MLKLALPHVCTFDAAGASTRECRSIGRVNDAVQHRAVVCGAFVERMDAGVHVFCRLHQPCKPSQVSMHGMRACRSVAQTLDHEGKGDATGMEGVGDPPERAMPEPQRQQAT